MATLVKMPAIVADADSAFLAAWLKSVGQTVAIGEPLAEIETEKATVEMEADTAGVVARLLVSPGIDVEVGTPIAVIAAESDDDAAIDALLAAAGAVPEPALAGAPSPGESDPWPQAPSNPADRAPAAPRVFSSPLARRLARELEVDLAVLVGTGPSGRILRQDVEAAAACSTPVAEPPAPEQPATEPDALAEGTERIELTRMRQVIARRLTESKTTVPHFYLTVDVRMDELLGLRKQINAGAPRKITVNDLVVRAMALALSEVPEANSTWDGDAIIRHRHADISVAIATETGLLTPIARRVESTSISKLSATIADYAQRAHAGKIRPEELAGGTFTVSNLGMFGTKEFSAILNPPQAGILAVGAAEPRPVVNDGELSVATVMTCTLSADHRVIDGAVAARLMRVFKERIEHPLSILL
ncbi:dihydrolipoamide acetyltransferase family protein [Paeniglutamicibacter gangotriensis]|uniref:Dihydrolipoamide acetyltransferase component of pyruvate dehydrogenase complex n=1 Tax=Paeniglutamicibacter gangotriensis Lz1y TaxID=1276920 RepID=M7NKQ2_9MICC|nr:dihydrolipoamide acetyltransferase family protein [Paeniglutamicibacter gangotriensis]EMQ99133.1 branched-chain alpha-keto acid dehydrogenase subunit E2 [Paeniglutamicibacter gangotriensis Lz1y]